MATLYPESFPCAQITPYTSDVDMGVLRTPMEGGYSRQRRLYRVMPTAFQLEFVMTVQQLGTWQPWVNAYAYDYFVMRKLPTMWAGQQNEIASSLSIRFTSNLQISPVVYGWLRVKVSAEMDPRSDSAPVVPTYNWIIGGEAPTPSADTVIAGEADAPAPDNVIAGTATTPAA